MTLKYESREIVSEKDFVIVHGRFSGLGQPTTQIAADRTRQGWLLVERWDVIEDEATQEQSKSGLPMSRQPSRKYSERNSPAPVGIQGEQE